MQKESIWILGCEYTADGNNLIQYPIDRINPPPSTSTEMVKSRYWLTYRYFFPCILPTRKTTDTGWGCVHRTTQMMLAETLRRIMPYYFQRTDIGDKDILQYFVDSPTALFSIHNIASKGVKYNRQIGSWFAPSDAGRVLKDIIKEANDPRFPTVMIATDGLVYTEDVDNLMNALQIERIENIMNKGPSVALTDTMHQTQMHVHVDIPPAPSVPQTPAHLSFPVLSGS